MSAPISKERQLLEERIVKCGHHPLEFINLGRNALKKKVHELEIKKPDKEEQKKAIHETEEVQLNLGEEERKMIEEERKMIEEERKMIEEEHTIVEGDINQLKRSLLKALEENSNLRSELELTKQNLEDIRKDIQIRFREVVGMFDKLQLEIEQLKTPAIEHDETTISLKNEEAHDITDDSDSDEFEICKRTPITEELQASIEQEQHEKESSVTQAIEVVNPFSTNKLSLAT
jgi:uncharacterized protein (DUF3084 family)